MTKIEFYDWIRIVLPIPNFDPHAKRLNQCHTCRSSINKEINALERVNRCVGQIKMP